MKSGASNLTPSVTCVFHVFEFESAAGRSFQGLGNRDMRANRDASHVAGVANGPRSRVCSRVLNGLNSFSLEDPEEQLGKQTAPSRKQGASASLVNPYLLRVRGCTAMTDQVLTAPTRQRILSHVQGLHRC